MLHALPLLTPHSFAPFSLLSSLPFPLLLSPPPSPPFQGSSSCGLHLEVAAIGQWSLTHCLVDKIMNRLYTHPLTHSLTQSVTQSLTTTRSLSHASSTTASPNLHSSHVAHSHSWIPVRCCSLSRRHAASAAASTMVRWLVVACLLLPFLASTRLLDYCTMPWTTKTRTEFIGARSAHPYALPPCACGCSCSPAVQRRAE